VSTPPPQRPTALVLVGVVVVLTVVGGAIVLLGDVGGAPDADPPATVSPTGTATPSPAPSPSPSPSESATPSASPTPSPSSGDLLTDLVALVPQRVGGFTVAANRTAEAMAAEPGAREARRVRYRNARGDEVTHLAALYSGSGTAGSALRQRRAQLLDRRGARLIDDIGLEDTRGVQRGRLLQVRTRSGDLIVLWRNRNLVGVLGPGRPGLQRRLYDAWPY
jgi:hypothetical protein